MGCTADGILNEAKFSEPLPWIGIYIAVASLACALVMAKDLIHGFRCGKFWFPNKFFGINATSLTVLTVAVKFSVDLNTPMPRRIDQLSKLSSSALICTVMGNSMPSLGTMENKDMMMNLIALGILVITVIVNICIQLGTGVIYLYWKEHAVIMFLMLCLLLNLSFSALTVPTTKKYLEHKYKKKYEMATEECSFQTEKEVEKKLRHGLMKFWMMAHTCSPQFVMGRSATCTAAGALCLISASTLAEAMLRSYLIPRSFEFCRGESDYKWSTALVLIAQTIAIGVGTIAPAIRWFTVVNFRCPSKKKNQYKRTFKVECYWIDLLVEMKECPFTIRIRSHHCRKLIHYVKTRTLDFCIGMQIGIVVGSKLIGLLSIYFIGQILIFWHSCKKLVKSNIVSVDSGPLESEPSSKMDLSRYVLHLEGENELVELMLKKNSDATDQWIQKGKKKQPKNLIQLLEKSSKGLTGVIEFDSDLVHSLDSEEPPNSWALPVVTLTAVAISIPNISSLSRKQLMQSVHEDLIYVKHIEDNLNPEGEMSNNRKAAYVVWQGIDLYQKWLDVDLNKLSSQAESTKEILEGLADAGKNRYFESKKNHLIQCSRESPANWPIKVLAANSMYRISQTILQKYEKGNNESSEMLFGELSVMISDILGACLCYLEQIISLKCLNSSVEIREESVRHAAFLLGETEKILKVINEKALPKLSTDEAACIDEWRASYKLKNNLPLLLASTESAESPGSCDLHLVVE